LWLVISLSVNRVETPAFRQAVLNTAMVVRLTQEMGIVQLRLWDTVRHRIRSMI
jgi:hypothetical protein